jgi:hypothetical protein
VEEKNSIAAIIAAESSFRSRTFSTPTRCYVKDALAEYSFARVPFCFPIFE